MYTNQEVIYPSSFENLLLLNKATMRDSPDTRHLSYRQHRHQLQLVNNIYDGVDSAKQYLFKFPQEIQTTFEERQDRATLRNFVRRAVEAFTGMIFRKAIEHDGWGARTMRTFPRIDKHQDLRAFTKQITTSATLDGKTFILVDSPQDASSEPYLVHVTRNQLINWRKDANGNFTMIVIEEILSKPQGAFGTQYYQQWRHYDENGDISIFERVAGSKDIIKVGKTITTDYPSIPLVEVTIDDIPMLYDIAKLNVKHFNRLSHKDRYLTMAALPIPVIWGAEIDDQGQSKTAKPALVIGVDEAFIFQGSKDEADFQWRELSGSSIQELEKDLNSITEDITTGILRAADSANTVQKTATEVALLQAEASDRVSAIAVGVETGMNKALQLLSIFMNEKPNKEAVFLLSKDFNAALAGTDGQRLLFESYMQGLVSIETYLQSLSDAELISMESTKNELEKIAADDFTPKPKVNDNALPAMDNRTKGAIEAGDKKPEAKKNEEKKPTEKTKKKPEAKKK